MYPDSDSDQLIELMNFISAVSHCYKEGLSSFGLSLIEMLNTSGIQYMYSIVANLALRSKLFAKISK